jgi:hypothetical protein
MKIPQQAAFEQAVWDSVHRKQSFFEDKGCLIGVILAIGFSTLCFTLLEGSRLRVFLTLVTFPLGLAIGFWLYVAPARRVYRRIADTQTQFMRTLLKIEPLSNLLLLEIKRLPAFTWLYLELDSGKMLHISIKRNNSPENYQSPDINVATVALRDIRRKIEMLPFRGQEKASGHAKENSLPFTLRVTRAGREWQCVGNLAGLTEEQLQLPAIELIHSLQSLPEHPECRAKMLEPGIKSEIASMVRSGFYSRERLYEVFTEEMYAPDELKPAEVSSELDAQFTQYELEKQLYPSTTDCDRLDDAFRLMNQRGVVAIQNAGYTQSDGFEDVGEAYSQHSNKESVLGYCFYHGQDLERAVNGEGLYFAFGPVNPEDERTVGVDVGNIVRESLENSGLLVEWDGTFENRLRVPKLNWQKR